MRNPLKFAAFILMIITLASSLQGCKGAAQATGVITENPSSAVTQLAAHAEVTFTPSPVTPGQPNQSPAEATSATPATNSSQGQYAVILVNDGVVLNVRKTPGTSSAVLETLPPHATGLTLTGKASDEGGEHWVEINRLTGGTGWVNAIYLTEYRPPSTFCGDAQAIELLDAFKNAIHSKNGEGLASLVSPLHGVTLQYLRGGKTVTYTPDKALWLFTSTYQMDWGSNPASGQEVKASFHEEVLPMLVDVLGGSYTPACNNIQTGGISYTYQWPFEYGNINFYSLYRADPMGNGQNWRTWLVGMEYVNGKPYLFLLVHLFWEP
jgi:hypothetical protein